MRRDARALRPHRRRSSTTPAARRPGPRARRTTPRCRRRFELTLLSTIRLTRLCLPDLRASGRGRVVTITASNVLEPSPGLALSNTMRAGVTAWAKTLAREEGPHGVTVNHVAPGYIDTDRLRYLYGEGPEAARRADAETIPARRFGGPRRSPRRSCSWPRGRRVHLRDDDPGRRRARAGPAELSSRPRRRRNRRRVCHRDRPNCRSASRRVWSSPAGAGRRGHSL